jgi:hypothetical protein
MVELLQTTDSGDRRIRNAISNTVTTTQGLIKLKTVEDINVMIKRLQINKAAMTYLYKNK